MLSLWHETSAAWKSTRLSPELLSAPELGSRGEEVPLPGAHPATPNTDLR